MTAASFHNGNLYWRDTFRTPDGMERQAEEFESVAQDDWFRPHAQVFAAEIRTVLAEYQTYCEETDVHA